MPSGTEAVFATLPARALAQRRVKGLVESLRTLDEQGGAAGACAYWPPREGLTLQPQALDALRVEGWVPSR